MVPGLPADQPEPIVGKGWKGSGRSDCRDLGVALSGMRRPHEAILLVDFARYCATLRDLELKLISLSLCMSVGLSQYVGKAANEMLVRGV